MKRIGGWNQEVTDEQGRRRFHGAFTGGFSAGYFNSVGSKEGWQPKTFSSSRQERNSNQFEQKIEDFMDEQDDPLLGRKLQTTDKYDTLQTHAKQALQVQQQQQQQQRQQIIPGFSLPDSFALPLSESIGKKLLIQMGWRDGQGIGPRLRKKKMITHEEERKQEEDEKEEEEIVYVAPKNQVDLHQFPKPKLDQYGAGFDPYVNAPEFERHRKSAASSDEPYKRQIVTFVDAMKSTEGSYKQTIGYGLGALEENDDIDVYGTVPMSEFDRELGRSLTTAKPVKRLDSIAQESKRHLKDHKPQICADGRPALTGFHLATTSKPKTKVSNAIQERLRVPSNFKAWHIFPEKKQEVSEIPALYQQYNFSTEKAGQQSVVTAKQRAALLSTDTVSTSTGTKSVFNLLDPSQKQKLLDAAQKAKAAQRTTNVSSMTTATTSSTMGEKFRASMSAAMANRFVSGSIQTSSGDIESNTNTVQPEAANIRKKSYRSESTWVPDRLLCKRFHVKWLGGDGDEEKNNEKSLFEKEIVDHVPQFGSASAVRQQVLPTTTTVKSTSSQQEEDLPPIEPIKRPQKDLLKSIFEASDESSEEEIDDEEEEEEEEEKKEEEKKDTYKDQLVTTNTTGTVLNPPPVTATVVDKKIMENSSESDSEKSRSSTPSDLEDQANTKVKEHTKKKKKKHQKRSSYARSERGRDKKKKKKKKKKSNERSRSCSRSRSRSRSRSSSRHKRHKHSR